MAEWRCCIHAPRAATMTDAERAPARPEGCPEFVPLCGPISGHPWV
jgi:hypothetical protein